ncbi:MAG: hypothetical protein H6510_01845 [Acidobacteria bacterium]|nr:hypothetical protein [Acidobacteriota bacterium]
MTKTHTRRNPKPAIIAQYEKLEEKFDHLLKNLLEKEPTNNNGKPIEYQQAISALEQKIILAKKKLLEFKQEKTGVWYDFKSELAILWQDIEISYKRLL